MRVANVEQLEFIRHHATERMLRASTTTTFGAGPFFLRASEAMNGRRSRTLTKSRGYEAVIVQTTRPIWRGVLPMMAVPRRHFSWGSVGDQNTQNPGNADPCALVRSHPIKAGYGWGLYGLSV